MGKPDETKPWSMIIGWIQTILLFAAVAGMFMQVGKQTHQLSLNSNDIAQLTLISTELLKFQVLSTANDRDHERRLGEILIRLERLEIPNQ